MNKNKIKKEERLYVLTQMVKITIEGDLKEVTITAEDILRLIKEGATVIKTDAREFNGYYILRLL